MYIEARTKYNIWDLLGDVGGFNDGLFLVVSLFMAPLSQLSFVRDYLNDQIVDESKSERKSTHSSENQRLH